MLPDLQAQFSNAVLTGNLSPACKHIRAGKLSAEKRLEIYRHNVFTTLTGALRDLYPVTESIVGASFFTHLAEQFIHDTPSRSGDLNMFGGAWPAFLSGHAGVDNLPYLPDVAALEWAWHRAFHAAEYPPFELSKLANVPPDQHGALRFILHPSVSLIASAYPIVRIWQVNQPGYDGEMAIDWDAAGDLALVIRDDVEIKIEAMPRASFNFLCALHQGESLEAASNKAFEAISDADNEKKNDPVNEENAEFDLQRFLVSAVQSNLIVDIR